jgi:AcrR family transcriptional regulator
MVEAILEATARVLVERGYAGTSTNLVAERAGVSVGSLYQYFPNKDALVTALHERHMRRMDQVFDDAFARIDEMSFDEALTTIIEGLVESHRHEADVHQVLERQLAGHEDLDAHRDAEAGIAGRIVALLERYRGELTVEDPRLAVFTLMHSLHALVHAAVLERPAGVPLKALTREIVRLARSYLKASD